MRIVSTSHIIETTPIGQESDIIKFQKDNSVFQTYQIERDGIRFMPVGGQTDDDKDDEAFIRERVADDLIDCIDNTKFIRNTEQGIQQDFSELETEHLSLLYKVKEITDSLHRDQTAYREIGLNFYNQAAESWRNDFKDTNLMEQVDPDFRHEDMTKIDNRKVV